MSAVEKFVACARAQVGKRYVWATAGPNTFDCSGLVAFCYEQATGEMITRSSYDQFNLGAPVAEQDLLRPGDLVFWGNGRADHVGIYSDSTTARFEWVINALNESRGVVETMLDAQYGMPYLGARRIFTDTTPTPEPPPNPKPGRDRDRQRQREKDRTRRRRRKA
jgi:cell wall-associated NlpC family hydrolase